MINRTVSTNLIGEKQNYSYIKVNYETIYEIIFFSDD
jgi:hypothetical protein